MACVQNEYVDLEGLRLDAGIAGACAGRKAAQHADGSSKLSLDRGLAPVQCHHSCLMGTTLLLEGLGDLYSSVTGL
jgi:hypothetical protein